MVNAISARGLTAQTVAARMSASEAATNARLLQEHAFDVTGLVTKGTTPYNSAHERFLVHFVEASFTDHQMLGCPQGLPVAVNLLDLTKKAHVGFIHFAVNDGMAISRNAVRKHYFGSEGYGTPLLDLLGQLGIDQGLHLNTDGDGIYGKAVALAVLPEYEHRNIAHLLMATFGFLSDRIYGASQMDASAMYNDDRANGLYLHLAQTVFQGQEGTKIVEAKPEAIREHQMDLGMYGRTPQTPATRYTFPAGRIEDYLQFVAIKDHSE